MMFQHSRQMHGIEPMDFLSHHQKMAERMLSPSQQQQQPLQMDGKRQRIDGANSVGGPQQDSSPYLHLQPNFFPIDPSNSTIVVSKSEYESIRQEVVGLKQTLTDFRTNIESELLQLKKENITLKEQVSKCSCGCKQKSHYTGTSNNDKLSEDDSNLNNSLEKGLEDEMAHSPTSRNLVDILSRENKRLHHTNNDLEKQIQQLRAANNRVPPIPSAQAMSFMRELMAYYTIIESNAEMNGGKMNAYGSDGEKGSFNNSSFDGHSIFATPLNSSAANNCSIYGNMPEAFDVEKGLQVQLLPNYNVWVSKSKLQLILKEATSLKDGAQLYVLRRLIPLVFTWEELATSRGQGLNCKSTDDILSKDPLDPTKVLVCKAYMRKFCLENGQPEPLEKSINETFSHQVNYARRKFKRGKPDMGDDAYHHHHQQQQQQCLDNGGNNNGSNNNNNVQSRMN
ncbi:hypothetical protein HELRODRAFT_193970 [Helobdella robusta]|uniref:BEN domain-containing protein n=1 Tax=Helobdella robusta TaxID=6412 RepID=T1FVI8_HELRO|nr:hypothetical protein HELRODRAFT_193970 [Helobdella robusta]ESN93794.1 hypothetical protein HELRODRAFT_193970 [Helobdella robusta]